MLLRKIFRHEPYLEVHLLLQFLFFDEKVSREALGVFSVELQEGKTWFWSPAQDGYRCGTGHILVASQQNWTKKWKVDFKEFLQLLHAYKIIPFCHYKYTITAIETQW